ncbi:hypothetical protein ACFLRF_05685 [Candidatus Altiarchaeota archaeon]
MRDDTGYGFTATMHGKLLTGILTLAILAVSGCTNIEDSMNDTKPIIVGTIPSTTIVDSGFDTDIWEDNDLMKALEKDNSYECNYTINGTKGFSLISYGMYRTKIMVDDVVLNSIFDGKSIYIWTDEGLRGERYGKRKFMPEIIDVRYRYTDMRSLSEMAENIECTPAFVKDEMFDPPKELKYTDISRKLERDDGKNGPKDPCIACSMIFDEETKADCLSNCNKVG